MNEKFKVTYKNGKMMYREILGVLEIVKLINRGTYIRDVAEVDHIALGETMNDLFDSFEHNDRNYDLAIWVKGQGLKLKHFPTTIATLEDTMDKIQTREYTIISWLSE